MKAVKKEDVQWRRGWNHCPRTLSKKEVKEKVLPCTEPGRRKC